MIARAASSIGDGPWAAKSVLQGALARGTVPGFQPGPGLVCETIGQLMSQRGTLRRATAASRGRRVCGPRLDVDSIHGVRALSRYATPATNHLYPTTHGRFLGSPSRRYRRIGLSSRAPTVGGLTTFRPVYLVSCGGRI